MKPLSTELTAAEKLKKLEAFAARVADISIRKDDEHGETLESLITEARDLRDELSHFDVIEYELPAHWASYLVNGDHSGLDDKEKAEVDAWLEKEGNPPISSCDGESYISRGNDATSLLCDTLKFTALVPKAKASPTDTERLDVLFAKHAPLPNDNRGMHGKPYIGSTYYEGCEGRAVGGKPITNRQELDAAIAAYRKDFKL